MVSLTVLFLLTVLCVCGKAAAEKKLVYVTVLFRHGDRSAINAYPTDPHKESDWPQGFGQLSKAGMKQHFELGKFLRKRYKGFLSESYDRHEILVRSTDFDRTLLSAEANLAGLYYPVSDQQVFPSDLKWQPVPVHTVSKSEEKLLSFPMGDCPRYKQLQKETEQTDEFNNITRTHQDIIDLLRNKTGLPEIDVKSVWRVYDTLFCEKLHNMSIPNWATDEVMEKLSILNDFGLKFLFGVYKQMEKSKLQGGVLLGEIVKNLSMMATPEPKQRLKLMMLSAHDVALVALQASLNVFNGRQPPYASCHIFELYRHGDRSVSVSMFYRNDSKVEPYQLQLPNCTLDCPLEDFKSLTKDWISVDRNKDCHKSAWEDKAFLCFHLPCQTVTIILMVAVCLFLIVLIVLCVVCVKYCRRGHPGHHPVINSDL